MTQPLPADNSRVQGNPSAAGSCFYVNTLASETITVNNNQNTEESFMISVFYALINSFETQLMPANLQ